MTESESSSRGADGAGSAAAPSSVSRLLHSRVGRELQRYVGDARLLACVVARRAGGDVLLISSSKRADAWVLPKGGWESDETLPECALREAEEEAGVTGVLERELGTLDFTTRMGKRCRLHGFQMAVRQEFDTWAESSRRREWVSFAEAQERLRPRPELVEMLMRTVE